MQYKLAEVPLSKISVWSKAQARELDRNGITELAKSIASDGLQNPPLVQKQEDQYIVISGQRRLAATRSLGKKTMPVLVLQTKQAVEGAKARSLIENIHRLNMNASDISKAVRFLTEQKSKGETMKMLGISKRTLERYLGFDALPEKMKEMVPDKVSREHAVRIYKHAANAADAVEIADIISKYDEAKKDRYIRALADNPKDTHDQLLRKSNRYYSKVMRLDIPNSMMQRLASESERQGMRSDQMISDIVKKWLQKR